MSDPGTVILSTRCEGWDESFRVGTEIIDAREDDVLPSSVPSVGQVGRYLLADVFISSVPSIQTPECRYIPHCCQDKNKNDAVIERPFL